MTLRNFTFWALLICLSSILGACGNQNSAKAQYVEKDSLSNDPAAPLPKALPDTVTFAFVGDIMQGTVFPSPKLPANDGKNLFDDAKAILRRADVAAGNLEGTLFDGKATSKSLGKNSYAFRTPAKYVDNLVDAGFDFLGVANNHCNDFGDIGRRETHKNLRDAGIKYAGIKGVCETAVIEHKGLKIGLTQFGHSRNTLSIIDYADVKRVVGGLAGECDIVVVSFHGGAEGKATAHVPHTDETAFGERRGNVEKFAHTAIDAGADIVFGHGPHVPRAAELYNDRIIFYSLGNFCTPYQMSLTGISGYAPMPEVMVDAKGNFLGGKIHSFIQKPGIGPRLDSSNAAAALIKSLSLSDFPNSPLAIASDGTLSRK